MPPDTIAAKAAIVIVDPLAPAPTNPSTMPAVAMIPSLASTARLPKLGGVQLHVISGVGRAAVVRGILPDPASLRSPARHRG